MSSSPSSSPAISNLLNAFQVSMISIGGIIGAGLFVGTSATIAASGPAVILSYLLAGGGIWLVMRLLAVLMIESDICGSFITHICHLVGPRAAFVTGWSYAFLWTVTAGAQAVAGGFILHQLVGIPALAGALAFIVIAWVINRMSLHYYGQAEAGLSILKLLFIGIFIVVCLFWLVWSGHPVALARQNLFDHGGFFPLGLWAVLGAVPMIMQSFSGCEIAVIAAMDSHDPASNIRKTVRRLPLQILFFYAGSVAVIVMLMPWSDIQIGFSPFLSVLQRMNVPFATWGAVAVTLIAILSCLNSSVYVVSRVMKELASLSLAPPVLARRTPRHVPLWALRITTFLELLIVLISIGSPARIYPVLLGAAGGLILFVYFMIAWSCRKMPPEIAGWYNRGLALFMIVLVPLLTVILFCLPAARSDAALSCATIGLLFLASVRIRQARIQTENKKAAPL